LGTAAIENPAFAKRALSEFGGDQVVFGLDALDGVLKTRGWRESSKETVSGFGSYLSANGAKTLIYTNIRRDGMGSGVDWKNAKRLAHETGLEVIASGGVNTLDDVKNVKAAGLGGVIIGRALYENKISLHEALSC
jgi:phosphoribosylformimino-5-aminoimidazole carboxamide ribotide isomerase